MGRGIQGNNRSQLSPCAGVCFWLWDPAGNCFVSVHCKIRTLGVPYPCPELPQAWSPMGLPACSPAAQTQGLTLSAGLPSSRLCPAHSSCGTSGVLLCCAQCGHGVLGPSCCPGSDEALLRLFCCAFVLLPLCVPLSYCPLTGAGVLGRVCWEGAAGFGAPSCWQAALEGGSVC